jgi:hypothetical protein
VAAHLQSPDRQHAKDGSADEMRPEVQSLPDDHRHFPKIRSAHGRATKAKPAPTTTPCANPAAATSHDTNIAVFHSTPEGRWADIELSHEGPAPPNACRARDSEVAT